MVCLSLIHPKSKIFLIFIPLKTSNISYNYDHGFTPGMSPYTNTTDNPVMLTDPEGKDFVILIAKDGASGYGHLGAVVQDESENFYYVTMGAAENASFSKMFASGIKGAMNDNFKDLKENKDVTQQQIFENQNIQEDNFQNVKSLE